LHENPQFVSVKGTTKKADAFGLFVYPNLSRALRVKNETSISENLVREWGPHLGLGVGGQKRKQVFISNSTTGKSAIFSTFALFPLKLTVIRP
jgi:hypothetical protein